MSSREVLETIPEQMNPGAACRLLTHIPEQVPGASVNPDESTRSQCLNSSKYTSDEEGEDQGCDHVSLDSEGCRFLGTDSVELSDSVTFPCSPNDFQVKSPLLEVLKVGGPNMFDGRRSAGSKASSNSDVPIDHSSLSQARCTPPPKMTFRKRRSKGTPKDSPALQTQVTSDIVTRGSDKPTPKRAEVFESKTEGGVTEEVCSGSRLLMDVDLGKCSGIYQDRTHSAPVLWGYDAEGGFFIPNDRRHAVKKWVSFGATDNCISPAVEAKVADDLPEVTNRDFPPTETKIPGTIDAEKLKDSLEMTRRKLASSVSHTEDLELEGDTEESIMDPQPLKMVQKSPHRGHRTVRTWAAQIVAAISPHRRRTKLTARKDICDIEGNKPNSVELDEKCVELSSGLKDTITQGGNVHDEEEETAEKSGPEEVTEVGGHLDDEPVEQQESAKCHTELQTAKPHKRRWSMPAMSPFTGLRRPKFWLNRKVSPMTVTATAGKKSEEECEALATSAKQTEEDKDKHLDVFEEIDVTPMTDLEPTYLETLQEMNKLSPSLRRLSERFPILQSSMGGSRSLEMLRAVSINSVETSNSDVPMYVIKSNKAASMDDVAATTRVETSAATLSHFITAGHKFDKPCALENTHEKSGSMVEVKDAEQETSDKDVLSPDKKTKKWRSLFGRGFGTWPRQRKPVSAVPGNVPEDEHVEDEEKENIAPKDKKKKGVKRKRFFMHKKKEAPPKPETYDAPVAEERREETSVKKHSIFGTLRKRLSLRRNIKKSYVVSDPASQHHVEDGEKQDSKSSGTQKDKKVTWTAPEETPNVVVLFDEPRDYVGGSSEPASSSTTSKASKNRRYSTEVWKVESSPERGDRWMAKNYAGMAPKLPRKAMLTPSTPLEASEDITNGDLSTDHRIKACTTRVQALLKKYQKTVEDNGVQESVIIQDKKDRTEEGRQELLDSVDKFFSYLDDGIDREETIDKVTTAQQTDSDSDTAEELVSYILKKIQPAVEAVSVSSPTLSTPGLEMEDFMAWCMVEDTLQKAKAEFASEHTVPKGTSYLKSLVEKNARRQQERDQGDPPETDGDRTAGCSGYTPTIQSNEESAAGLNLNLNANSAGASYYKRMNEDFFDWVTTSHDYGRTRCSVTSPMGHFGDESLVSNEEVRAFFDTSQDVSQTQTLVPEDDVYRSPDPENYRRILIEGFNTPTQREESSELMEIMDAFFGKKPTPMNSVEVEDMKQKLSQFAAYHAKHFSEDVKDSPAAKRIKATNTDEGYSTQSQSQQGPVSIEDSQSESLDNWQLWHSALTQSAPTQTTEQQEEIMEDQDVQASNLVLEDVSIEEDLEQDLQMMTESQASSGEYERSRIDSESSEGQIVGFVRGGLSSCSGSCESGVAVSTDPHTHLIQSLYRNVRPTRNFGGKRAGSFFYGEELNPSKVHADQRRPPTPRRDPSVRPAGSFFLVESPWKQEKPKAVRRSWTSSSSTPERQSNIKRARHSDICTTQFNTDMNVAELCTPRSRSLCTPGEKTYPPMWVSPKPEDRPVGVHFGQQQPFGGVLDKEMTHNLKLLRSPKVEDRPVGIHVGQLLHPDCPDAGGAGVTPLPCMGMDCACRVGGTCPSMTTLAEDLDSSFLTGHAANASSYDANSYYSIDSADFSASTDD